MTRYARSLAVIFAAIVAAGCVSVPGNPERMSPAQLSAWAKDKNANIACGVVNSPYGRGIATYVVLDKGVVFNGSVAVDPECKITITNEVPQRSAPAGAPASRSAIVNPLAPAARADSLAPADRAALADSPAGR